MTRVACVRQSVPKALSELTYGDIRMTIHRRSLGHQERAELASALGAVAWAAGVVVLVTLASTLLGILR